MNQPTTESTNMTTTTSLTIRQGGLMRRTGPRMQSFRLPKETTSALLDFHCDDEPENDNTPEQEQEEQPLPLNRRKMALSRNKQRMTSFRLPSHKTHQLLLNNTAELSDDSDQSNAYDHEMDASEPATVTTPPPREDNLRLRRVRALQTQKARMNSFRLPKETTKPLLRQDSLNLDASDSDNNNEKNRRCQALRQHTHKMRLNSFRLPKENTKQMLQMMMDDEPSEEEPEEQVVVTDKSRRCQSLRQHTRKMRLQSFRLPKETTKDLLHFTAEQEEEQVLPRRVIRQSSLSARSA